MAYEKKTWVNVPDPDNYDGDLNSLPRFDAKNMNRIEDGVEQALNLTIDDFGAVPVLRRLNGIDILTVNSEGLYYCINTINMPTTTAAGYLRVEYSAANYKVIYWRAYNSQKQYVNVLDGGTWIGWSEIFTDKGGTLTGNISIERDSVPMIELVAPNTMSRIMKNSSETSDGGLIIKDYADDSDSSSGAYIRLSHKIAKENLSEALKFALIGNGTTSSYNIFGEHNREAMGIAKIQIGSYVGTGVGGESNPNSLTFDFEPKIVYCFTGQLSFGNRPAGNSSSFGALPTVLLSTEYKEYMGFGSGGVSSDDYSLHAKKSSDGKTIYWYSDYTDTQKLSAQLQNNISGQTYHYIAIG